MILRWLQRKNISINFIEQQENFYLSLHYNGAISYTFVNGVEIYKFKAKTSEINAGPLSLGQRFNRFLVDDMSKTGLYGYAYDFFS